MPFDRSADAGGWLVGRRPMTLNGVMVQGTSDQATPDEATLRGWIAAIATDRDRSALAALFGHYAPRLKAYLLRRGCEPGMAEEVVQEVMVTLWRRAETFNPAFASATTWIFTIARNKRIDLVRRERRPGLDPEEPALQPDAGQPVDHRLEVEQDSERLRTAMRSLPEEQRSLLEQAFFEDKAHSAIAQETGLPLGTVKSRIRLAMSRLRKQLQDA